MTRRRIPLRMSFADCAGRATQALRRLEARPQRRPQRTRAFYKGASMSRLNADGIFSTTSSDQELRDSLRKLRARARGLAANSSYAKWFLTLLKSNVLGPHGISSRARVRDASQNLVKAVNDQIDLAWTDWASRPVTLDRGLTLVQAEHLILETVARDGEALVRMVFDAPNPHRFALQLIDADCLDETYNRPAGLGQNEIRMGVEVDGNGAPVGYWLWELGESSGLPVARRRYFAPAYDPFTRRGEVLHLFLRHRVNQTRGPSWFHAVMEQVHQLGEYFDGELFGSRLGASTMGFIEPGEDAEDPADIVQPAAAGEETEGDPQAQLVQPRVTRGEEIETAPGLWYRLHHGEKVTTFAPEHPTTAFAAFVKTTLAGIAGGLGIQYFELANDLEGVNYTSSRTGKLTQWDVWRMLHAWWIASFRRVIRDEWLNMAMLAGALEVDGRRLRDARRYEAAAHQARGYDWVDPLRDAQAAALQLQLGITSRTRIVAEKGLDFEDVLEELAQEKRLSAEYGVPIEPPLSLGADIAKTELADAIAAAAEPTTTGGNGNGQGRELPAPIAERLRTSFASTTR